MVNRSQASAGVEPGSGPRRDGPAPAWALLALLPLVPPIVWPGIGALASFGIVVLALILVKDARIPTMRMLGTAPGTGPGAAVKLGLGAGIVLAFAFAFAVKPFIEWSFGEPVDLSSFVGVEGNLEKYILLLALGLIFGGVIEELVFRGFVVGWGSHILGDDAARWLVLLSAGAFGFAHLYQGWAGVASTGLAGLALGLVYLAGGRGLLPAILVHMILNFVGITALYLGIDG